MGGQRYVKLCKARVDWILERMIGGGDGCVREEVKRLRDWIDGSDLGRGGFTSGSGAGEATWWIKTRSVKERRRTGSHHATDESSTSKFCEYFS